MCAFIQVHLPSAIPVCQLALYRLTTTTTDTISPAAQPSNATPADPPGNTFPYQIKTPVIHIDEENPMGLNASFHAPRPASGNFIRLLISSIHTSLTGAPGLIHYNKIRTSEICFNLHPLYSLS